ncbi:RNA-directed DNA polymerase [Sphingomonas sp. RRHST34]|uniref:RNA-directed DNA polymerase n=1 Tax=Sphingomonas citri TaxID=2862499 RepID=A0ABS7BMA4_9SPHN|nr:RNA-directed DNA polymerase [Sphingomonas citri]
MNYDVLKERGKNLTLSIPHPIAQLRMARLFDDYAETMISACDKSEFSLRRPAEIVSLFANKPLDQSEIYRDGLPHDLLEDGLPDFSRMTSFFRLRRYNLLAKFMDSDEFIELEKRFSRLLFLDISKCFYNIYTHSVSWAVKGKALTKQNIRSFSFESMFDETMQFSNYKETNGIIVGPEISRIFAEIILQQVDRDVKDAISQELELTTADYAIRRYVDDYSIFAHSDQTLEAIQNILVKSLGAYKLYLNIEKSRISNRPFVTPITRMKHAVASVVDDVGGLVRSYLEAAELPCERSVSDHIREKLRNCRIILHSPDVGFHNVSGWFLWKFRRIIRDGLRLLNRSRSDDEKDCASRITASLFEMVFYVVSLDFRVRSGFNLAVIVNELRRATAIDESEQSDWLNSYVFEELLKLTDSAVGRGLVGSLELSNLLLLGAHAFGKRFVRSSIVRLALSRLAHHKTAYFDYVALKFCYLKDSEFFAVELHALNAKVRNFIHDNIDNLRVDTETYLLFCDYVSSPDVAVSSKIRLVNEALSMHRMSAHLPPISDHVIAQLTRFIGFTDWTGARLHHTLARRQLRASREY